MFGNWCSGMGIGGWFVMIGLWAALIAAVVWAITRLFPDAHSGRDVAETGGTPREILDRRLATGEIDPQTYDRLVHDLTSTRS